ncbi:MAG: CHASE2 domain-containing protein [Desulfobaccales bacterium]
MPFISKVIEHRWGRALSLGVAVWLMVLALATHDLGRTLENLTLDLCCRLQPTASPPREVLIIGIDAASFQTLGLKWPWPRRYHARLINRLTEAGAALIMFDVFFGEASNQEDDRLLEEAVKKSGKVILSRVVESTRDPLFSRQIILNPLEQFSAHACGLGVSLVTPDPDGVVRRFHLSPAGQVTLAEEVIRVLKPDIVLPAGLSGLIRYLGPPRHLESFSYYELLADETPLPRQLIQDRIILVGRMVEDTPLSQGQVDAFLTPFSGSSQRFMSGVEIQATIIHNLLSRTWVRELSPGHRAIFYLVVLSAFSLIGTGRSPKFNLGLFAALATLLSLGAWLAQCGIGLWIQPLLLVVGLGIIFGFNLIGHHLADLREKRWLHQAFSHFIPQEVVETLISNPERLDLGGEELETTVMFATLAGFSGLSQFMPPKDLIDLLSDYFTPLTEIILAHHGTLDKYMGSGLMAVWGPPCPTPTMPGGPARRLWPSNATSRITCGIARLRASPFWVCAWGSTPAR